MKPWSKLQKELYKLISPDVPFQIHCVAYPMRSQYGGTDIPRYWMTIGKEIVWDYPKDFIKKSGLLHENYPYQTEVSDLSELIREYIDSPKNGLLQRVFTSDKWGLTEILKLSDKRIGKRQLKEQLLSDQALSPLSKQIIALRLK